MSCGDGGVSYQYVTHILANVTNNAGGEENRRSRRLQKTQRRMTAAGREELKRRLAPMIAKRKARRLQMKKEKNKSEVKDKPVTKVEMIKVADKSDPDGNKKGTKVRVQDKDSGEQGGSKKLFSARFDAGLVRKMFQATREALRNTQSEARVKGKQASDFEHDLNDA